MRRIRMYAMAVLALGFLATQVGCANATGGGTAEPAKQVASAPAQAAAPKAATPKAMEIKTQKELDSYSFGVETARNLKRQGMDVDPEFVKKGLEDAQAGNKLLMTDDAIRASMNKFTTLARVNQARQRLAAELDNKKAGEAFLAENKTKEGVVALLSGLQYKILKAGTGPVPKESDVVICHYRGTLIDGTEFDSSAHANNEGDPTVMKLSQVIPGWRQAITRMPVGSKWRIFVPHQLAYGQQGAGILIGPNATLIFDIDLIGIQ